MNNIGKVKYHGIELTSFNLQTSLQSKIPTKGNIKLELALCGAFVDIKSGYTVEFTETQINIRLEWEYIDSLINLLQRLKKWEKAYQEIENKMEEIEIEGGK